MKNKYKLYRFINGCFAVVAMLFWGMVAITFGFTYVQKNYIYPLKYKDIVFECADTYALDRALVYAVIKTESSFNKNSVSKAGAVGLMQLTMGTADYIASLQKIEEYDLKDEYTNVWFGCFYLRYLLDKFDDVNTSMCAYNAGEGNVALWLNNKEYSRDGVTLMVIPFNETRQYLEKINKSYKNYRKLYGNILDKRKNFE